jgi:chemotaxis protein CheD
VNPSGEGLHSLRAGEMLVRTAPTRMIIHGLGSCVAVFLYDPEPRVGGLAHILLPGPPRLSDARSGRYAPTAVAAMIDESIRLGARRSALLAKVTGGSRMFSFDGDADRVSIGDKNVESVLAALREAGIALVASDLGGDRGRTVLADLRDGSLTIRTVRGAPRVL